MSILVTGSSGHLGEALVRTLIRQRQSVRGLDVLPGPYTSDVGSLLDRAFVRSCMQGADAVLHTATLHKPHVVSHSRQAFVDTNITGTLNLLEEAHAAGVRRFVFTSTTSVFGHAMEPPQGGPAVWVSEDLPPAPKNIYGITKHAAENLCELVHRKTGLPCIVLRTSRFFPEEDDNRQMRKDFEDGNAKANEFLFRRVDIADAVSAHLAALERAPSLGFARYIISATSPFTEDDLSELAEDAAAVLKRRVPAYEREYRRRGWRMFPKVGRVYVNERARSALGWAPVYDFEHVLAALSRDEDPRSPLARAVGSKGYHEEIFADGPYPVE